MTTFERLGPFTLSERRSRAFERAARRGWPDIPGINGNETSWRLQTDTALPGHLDHIERCLAELEAQAERREALEREWSWQDRQRRELEQADLAALANRLDRARR
jgi:hypothetical protein